MALITPDTFIKLVRCDVTKEHQITFSNIASQKTYFENLTGVTMSAVTYQRKDYKIRFNSLIDDIIKYNYLYYYNDVNDRIYYCYITNMEYVNDNLTDVTIETDVFQTYQFDFIYKQCFVEREHTNDDTPGKNNIPEGLEHGEYVPNAFEDFAELKKYVYMLQVTKEYNAPYQIVYGTKICGTYHVGKFYLLMSYQDVCDAVNHYTNTNDLRN